MLPLYSAITLAKNASRCIIAFEPSVHLCSNITANFNTSGFIYSGNPELPTPYFFKNSLANTPNIISGVIPLVSSSYNFVLICLNYFGLYSYITSLAMSIVYVSYSGLGTKVFSLKVSCLSFIVYNIIIALLKFLLDKLVIEAIRGAGKLKFSFCAIYFSMRPTSFVEGAGTLTCMHLDLKGWITLERLSQLATILQ